MNDEKLVVRVKFITSKQNFEQNSETDSDFSRLRLSENLLLYCIYMYNYIILGSVSRAT